MQSTSTQRIAAGLSLWFASGERPDLNTVRKALEGCQTQAMIVREDELGGEADLIVSGLGFEVDGLMPAVTIHPPLPPDRYGFDDAPGLDAVEAIRIYPGHALSGGLTLRPVAKALLAVAAELAMKLPVLAVHWHPADTLIEARHFSRSVLAWLAGGTFPAPGLVALSPLADGSVVSRGLAHFIAQELSLREAAGPEGAKLATQVVDQLVRSGPLSVFTQWRMQGTLVSAEPAREAKQILAWRAE
jgi:hypothetical protein